MKAYLHIELNVTNDVTDDELQVMVYNAENSVREALKEHGRDGFPGIRGLTNNSYFGYIRP